MLYNYRQYSDLYASGELYNMTETSRYSCFPFERKKNFQLCINGIKPGVYQVTENIISRKYGSAFDKWLESGAMEPNAPLS